MRGESGFDERSRTYKKGRLINMVTAIIQQKKFFSRIFFQPQNMCFIAQQKTTLNSSLLLRSYLSDHCWSRHLIASDVSRFLFDFCICRAWLIMWTMSTFEAEKLPGLCGGAPWVCQVPCWDLSGELSFLSRTIMNISMALLGLILPLLSQLSHVSFFIALKIKKCFPAGGDKQWYHYEENI